jgi:nucleoside-diphosphate-sugar epimerase
MRILVTGGDGFIGRHLVKMLLERGDFVEIIDNNITSVPDYSHENLNRIIDDVCDLNENQFPKELDVIVHLASVAIPQLYMKKPELVIFPNVFGTNKICNLAEKYGARVIFTSTSEVYGSITDDSPIGTAISELDPSHHTLLNARSPYSNAKKMGEEIVAKFVQNSQSGCSIRLFNVVGPRMDNAVLAYGRVFPNFIEAINESRPLQIYGTGEQTRSFLWIEDAIKAILKIIDFDGDLPLAINIGNPEPVTINSLAEKFQYFSNRFVGVQHLPGLPHEPKHRCPDISLANSLLEWEPTIVLDDIIKRVVEEGVGHE